mmetsp:Transcript_46358/g.72575  ORF Transcript_46358/g.72575 Transcript_46358/m.72575 type:complete len:140 (-) Transcript_46358:1014-1433(-)
MDILDEPNFHQHGNHGFCTDMTAGFVPTSSADHFVSRHLMRYILLLRACSVRVTFHQLSPLNSTSYTLHTVLCDSTEGNTVVVWSIRIETALGFAGGFGVSIMVVFIWKRTMNMSLNATAIARRMNESLATLSSELRVL